MFQSFYVCNCCYNCLSAASQDNAGCVVLERDSTPNYILPRVSELLATISGNGACANGSSDSQQARPETLACLTLTNPSASRLASDHLTFACLTPMDQHFSSSNPQAYDGYLFAACLETLCSEQSFYSFVLWTRADLFGPMIRSVTSEHFFLQLRALDQS